MIYHILLGMRGKKDVTNVLDEMAEKRAPSGGFFGMRGKKGPSVCISDLSNYI